MTASNEAKAITVADLIAFLQTQPQDLPVAFRCFSEQCLLSLSQIEVATACAPRPDGWVQHGRDDKPQQQYLMFPGN